MQRDHPIAKPRIDPAAQPFSETEAFRRYGSVADPDLDVPEGLYLKALIIEQGFDGLPHVVSRRELNAYVAAGERELFRGVSNEAHAEAFRTGTFFIGRGIYGGGANASAGPAALAVAREYAAGGVILRLTLKREARVADFDPLGVLTQSERGDVLGRLASEEERALADARTLGRDDEIARVRARYASARAAVSARYDDIGRLGAYLGYDAIHAAVPDFYAILNRSAVRVQRESLR